MPQSSRGEDVKVRALLVINATISSQEREESTAGRRPRKDYLELQRRLAADVLDLGALDAAAWTRLLRRLIGAAATQALMAWRLSARYDAIFADRETTGVVLATLLRFRRARPRLVLIGHMLTSLRKRMLFRLLRVHTRIDCLVVHSSLQQRIAERALRVQPHQVVLLPYQTDEHFWAPRQRPAKRQICSAGLEYRDYATLIEASRGLDVEVVIAAASHWSKHRGIGNDQPLPGNVRVVSLDYAGLRELYAESAFVVVPLHDVENQAGITTILEGMAMGKALVVSHTRGQTDVVRDRRRESRSDPTRPTQPEWARTLGATAETASGHTGIYVRPGDPHELRQAICFLLNNPQHAETMGTNGRRLVEESMGLDHFSARVAALLQGERTSPATGATAPRLAQPEMDVRDGQYPRLPLRP